MRKMALIAAAAAALVIPSFQAQAEMLTGGTAFTRHVCDCRKMGNDKTFPLCMKRRLGYEVQAATVASVVCADPKAKK
jgi:hypothetical protein